MPELHVIKNLWVEDNKKFVLNCACFWLKIGKTQGDTPWEKLSWALLLPEEQIF